MADADADPLAALVAHYAALIAEAERHNLSVADALVAEVGAILAAMMLARQTPVPPAPTSRYSSPWRKE